MTSYSVNFKTLSTNHIIISAKVNNIKGNFIIDTGASNSCIDFNKRSKYKLNFEISKLKASSATTQINETFCSINNIIEIANLKKNNFEIILFDMTYINNSLKENEINEIDGIIGGDVLKELNVIIDYKKGKLYLDF